MEAELPQGQLELKQAEAHQQATANTCIKVIPPKEDKGEVTTHPFL